MVILLLEVTHLKAKGKRCLHWPLQEGKLSSFQAVLEQGPHASASGSVLPGPMGASAPHPWPCQASEITEKINSSISIGTNDFLFHVVRLLWLICLWQTQRGVLCLKFFLQ